MFVVVRYRNVTRALFFTSTRYLLTYITETYELVSKLPHFYETESSLCFSGNTLKTLIFFIKSRVLFVWLIYDCIKDFSTVTVIFISTSILSKSNVLTLWVVFDILHKRGNMNFCSPLNMIARRYFITGKRYSLNRLFCVYKSFMIEPKKSQWFYDILHNICNSKNKHIFSTSSCLN